MDDFFSPAIIAASTSLLISIITLFQFFKNQRFQQRQFNDSLNRTLTTKLYDLRLEHYPKAFEITDNVYRKKGGNYDFEAIQGSLRELIDWKKGTVDLIISIEASDGYYKLRDALMKNPSHKNRYSNEQVEKIHSTTKYFRRQLRRDLGFLFREEKARRRQN